MKEFNLLKPNTKSSLHYSYEIGFRPEKINEVHLKDGYLIFFRHQTIEDGVFLSDQLEIPLVALDPILAILARYDIPINMGGLGGLKHADPFKADGEKLYFYKYLHPHYGIETYSITNFNRGAHIDPQQKQIEEIFKETMDGGLLEKLIEINKDFHDGVYG